ncbi:MAG TPA: DUF6370 family protein [Magnetospirillaceae bacterium]|nr:DUF6370 family protein [Magnetospirillaceae bacterium]
MHEGKHGILDGVDDMDDVFGIKGGGHSGHDDAQVQKPYSGAVEAGCGMCIFKMKDQKECRMAVKIGDRPYLVGGSAVMDHKDAHGEHGMCSVSRKAVVDGRIEGDRFIATRFALMPYKK